MSDKVESVRLTDELGDKELLDFWENNKNYAVGFAPSGDWSAFDVRCRGACYGKTLRECLRTLQIMHADIGT